MKDLIMLKYPTLTLSVILLSMLLVGTVFARSANGEPQILMLTVDSGTNMLDRHSAAHKILVRKLRSHLQKSSYQVLEQNRNQFKNNQNRQSRRLAINLARRAGLNDMDALLLVAAKKSQKRQGGEVTFVIEMMVQIVDPQTWKSLKNIRWTTRPQSYDRYDCREHCQARIIVRHIKKNAKKFQSLVKRRLEHTLIAQASQPPAISWRNIGKKPDANPAGIVTLTLKGFTKSETLYLEDRLISFSKNSDISLRKESADSREYWYETDISANKLQQKLSDDLDRMGVRARFIDRHKDITVIKQQREMAYFNKD